MMPAEPEAATSSGKSGRVARRTLAVPEALPVKGSRKRTPGAEALKILQAKTGATACSVGSRAFCVEGAGERQSARPRLSPQPRVFSVQVAVRIEREEDVGTVWPVDERNDPVVDQPVHAVLQNIAYKL